MAANPMADLLGKGAAKMAGNTIALQKQYTQYASAQMEQGKQPLPFADWVKSIGGGTIVNP